MSAASKRIISLTARGPTVLPSLRTQRPLLLSASSSSSQTSHSIATIRSSPKIHALTPEDGQALLARQRLRRPVSPHLSIYKWQIHSVSSALERITGLLLAGPLYLYGTVYFLAPHLGLGWDLSSASIAAVVAGFPAVVRVGLKFALAWPFTFHVVNGVRYLVTAVGTGTMRSRGQVVKIAWAVVGVSFVGAAGLVSYL
ncbi:succinate:quinone oxidoreductase subunit C [Aspergillus undulatus]|uniref:succinate:quinone oxidoreductase subunit C n=1 Tax=Aspergillus undulatus TaxID=1810928 RepID=UPI003CCD6887